MVSAVNQTSISSMCQAYDEEMTRPFPHRGREHIKVPGEAVKFSTANILSAFLDVDFVFEADDDITSASHQIPDAELKRDAAEVANGNAHRPVVGK